MALEIFVDRLPAIKPAVRAKSSSRMASIVQRAGNLLSNSALTSQSLESIRAIVATALPSEDAALSLVVPKIVGVAQKGSGSVVVAALSLLELST